MSSHAVSVLVTGVVVPSLAIVISAGIAVTLAALERRASRLAREQERADRVLEDVLDSLAFFVSANPLGEKMAPAVRRLRSRITLMQSLPRERDRLIGLWLAREVEVALPLFSAGMEASGPYVDPTVDEILGFFKPAHRAFHRVLVGLSAWMRDEIDDERVRARITLLTPDQVSPPVGDAFA